MKPGLGQRLLRELRIDLWAMTVGLFVNGLLGIDAVPRVLRWLGYRLAGARIDTPNIFGSGQLHGPMGNIHIGAGTFINREVYLEAVAPISIGRDCQLGPQVMVVTSHHDRLPTGRISTVPEGREVRIGDRAWVGARVLILPGVTIGDDVVIGAGSVVTKDCVKPGVYVGSPARELIR
ncbi:MAG TPA: DapH/DapD/GlmU-related protein [Pseudonocardiaceae bacterium]|jgi:acetyltransferase-like isoleucine patch superfamily enzyme|nr:DapH/DapD/GlmU-related protein [Pseudonocardiaceae bacterium]